MRGIKKKGFTLVELIAVIAVLSVILAIAVPTISGVINKSRMNSFEIDAKVLLKALDQKKLKDRYFDPTTVNENTLKDILGIKNENYEKLTVSLEESIPVISIVGKNEWDGFIVCGTYDDVKVVENSSDCSDDNVPPVITIIGNNPANINMGGSYTDQGATAEDNIDGNITSKITKAGNVTPSIPGIYKITYTVSDSAGNVGSADRTVNVIDNVAPTIIFGTNGNSAYAKNRATTVTVTDVGGVNTSSLKYLWNTSTATLTESSFASATSFTNGGTITTPAGVSGSYYLWILAKDTSGNTTISSSNVFNLDNTVPVITIAGSNPANVNVGSTYTDAGATATDNIDTNITVTSTGTVNTSVVGTYTITYNTIDSSGNAAVKTRTVNVTDNVAPTIAFGTNGNVTYAKNRATTVTVSDNVAVNTSSLKYLWNTSTTTLTESSFTSATSFTNGGTITTPAGVSGSYYLWILAKDTSGNIAISRSNVFNLDNTAPIITIIGNSTITLAKGSSYTDQGASATDNIDGTVAVTSTGTVNPNIVGTYVITYNATDSSGNVAASKTRTINVVDVSAPVITMLGSNPITINAGTTYSDAGATAVDDVDGNVTSRITATSTVNPNLVGTYYVTYTVKDNAGNTATATRTVIVIKVSYAFGYTGGYQAFTVPYTGTYKLETWGAQGGSGNGALGGYGGYTSGDAYLTAGTQLVVEVGEANDLDSYGVNFGASSPGGKKDLYYTDYYYGILRGGGRSSISYYGEDVYFNYNLTQGVQTNQYSVGQVLLTNTSGSYITRPASNGVNIYAGEKLQAIVTSGGSSGPQIDPGLYIDLEIKNPGAATLLKVGVEAAHYYEEGCASCIQFYYTTKDSDISISQYNSDFVKIRIYPYNVANWTGNKYWANKIIIYGAANEVYVKSIKFSRGNYSNVINVAGGGGGASVYNLKAYASYPAELGGFNGGAGGGLVGGSGYAPQYISAATGGSQSGIGTDARAGSTNNVGFGAGGGYFRGGGGTTDFAQYWSTQRLYVCSGAGGSSYVGSMSNTTVLQGVRAGHGYAIITYLGS